MERRVVITGLGVVSPVGNGKEEFWNNLLAGKPGVGPITQFDATDFPVKIAGEVKDFDPVALAGDRKTGDPSFASITPRLLLIPQGVSETLRNSIRDGFRHTSPREIRKRE